MQTTVLSLLAGSAAALLSKADLARANLPKPLPTSHVVGANGALIFRAMNTQLQQQAYHTQPCEDWSPQELNELSRLLWTFRSEQLAAIYDDKDDNRKFHFADFTYKEKLWAEEHLTIATQPTTHGKGTHNFEVMRDGKCAELVMWWIHHLPAQARSKLAGVEGFRVPLLPAHGLRETDNHEYIYQVQCSSCHSTGLHPEQEQLTAKKPMQRSTESVGDRDVPPGTCPIDVKTGLPSVWYQPMSDVGNRLKRCDWDYDPPCQPCEGIGGYSWGEQEHEISYNSCEVIAKPADIPKDNLTTPTWPAAFTVPEVTTLINQEDKGAEGGRFPGADPCAKHNYQNDTEILYFDATAQGPIMYTNTSQTDIWTLPTADMFIKIENAFCICVTPKENGNASAPATGPLYHDFAKDAVLVGRELIGLEGFNKKVVADHWNKGPHHFWMSVETNLMVRGWQPWNGLNVYGDWKIGKPDPKIFTVPKSCYSGLLFKNISCIAPYP